jgi:hypothetical protein
MYSLNNLEHLPVSCLMYEQCQPEGTSQGERIKHILQATAQQQQRQVRSARGDVAFLSCQAAQIKKHWQGLQCSCFDAKQMIACNSIRAAT